MKVTQSLKLQSSLMITTEMRLAIQMLAMGSQEVDDLIDEELIHNPCLIENSFGDYAYQRRSDAFEMALERVPAMSDFRDYLFDQVKLNKFNALERAIAEGIIYNLDDDGLLLEYEQVVLYLSAELSVWPEWVESVRRRIMHLDPVGCGARSVSEALATQAERLLGPKAYLVLDYKNIRAQDYAYLKALKPRPAQAFNSPTQIYYCEADLAVIKNREGFYIMLLKKPSGRIFCEKAAHKSLKRSFSRAYFLLKSLRYREYSLQRVAHSIVEHQAGWFFKGQVLKALTLKQIAVNTGLHESSVSRLVRNKYIATDTGIFELKYFFSQSVKSSPDNLSCSNITVKDLIKKIVKRENAQDPLSDEKIKSLLETHGYIISRRTVTKYRLGLGFGAAYQRRR